jgi:hypothetical protein
MNIYIYDYGSQCHCSFRYMQVSMYVCVYTYTHNYICLYIYLSIYIYIHAYINIIHTYIFFEIRTLLSINSRYHHSCLVN